MANVRITGIDRTVKVYDRFQGRQAQQRIVTPALEEGAREFMRQARRTNFGFTDRSGRLRRSVRLGTAKARSSGRFISALEVSAERPYAAYVEFKRRTRDRRPGPPYWFGRLVAKFTGRSMRSEAERRIRRNSTP